MVGILRLAAAPSMPNYGGLLASRTNANHRQRLAFGVIPWDKYNHCGAPKAVAGSPLERCPVVWPSRLLHHTSIWKKNLILPLPRIGLLRLAGKPITELAKKLELIPTATYKHSRTPTLVPSNLAR